MPEPRLGQLVEIAWHYRPGDPTSYDSEIGILIRRNGQDYVIRSIKDGRCYNGDILVRQLQDKEKCPRCGKRGFYAAIGIYWIFRCDHCGYKDGNTPKIMKQKRRGDNKND